MCVFFANNYKFQFYNKMRVITQLTTIVLLLFKTECLKLR